MKDIFSSKRKGPIKGFTLIELMVVMALLVIIVSITFPAAIRSSRKAPMEKAITILKDAFSTARLRAVLSGNIAAVKIEAGSGLIMVEDEFNSTSTLIFTSGDDNRTTSVRRLPQFSEKLPQMVAFRDIMVNGTSYMHEKDAFVRFYPNGTSDIFEAMLIDLAGNRVKVSLNLITGAMQIEESL